MLPLVTWVTFELTSYVLNTIKLGEEAGATQLAVGKN